MLFQFGSFWMKAMTKRGGGSKGLGDIVFMTGMDSLKAKNIECCNRVSICVDDQFHHHFLFVTIFGIARIYQYNQTSLFQVGY